MINFRRSKQNPIITGGKFDYRRIGTFNPGVIYEDKTYYLYERAIESIRPLYCHVGLLTSKDGINFEIYGDKPIFSAKELGYPQGTIEDPRVCKIEDTYYMTFAFRSHTFNCNPTGYEVPDYGPLIGTLDGEENYTLIGIAKSKDKVNFEFVTFVNGDRKFDDRDGILFPEKINGKFILLRRPMQYVGPEYGCNGPSIWFSSSDDLLKWSSPKLLAIPENDWEGGKIGACAPPIKTKAGWLLFYHGVDEHSVYRVGAMLLDLNDPTKILYRTKNFLMEPTEYYEKFGLIIPNVIFPTGNVLVKNRIEIFYGCCDTSISKATVSLPKLLRHLKSEGKKNG